MQLVMHQLQSLKTDACGHMSIPSSFCLFLNHCAFQSKNFPPDVKEATAEIKSETKKAAGSVFLFQV